MAPMQQLTIDWLGGNCPVQAEGTISGKPFYFRARGEHWKFSVGADPHSRPDWQFEENYSDVKYAAGWMTESEAISLIEQAAALYLEEMGIEASR